MNRIVQFLLLFFAGISSAQEINITRPTPTTNVLTGSTYTFANTVSGTATAVTFTIQNTQAASVLTLSGPPIVTVSGVDASLFVVNETATSNTLTNVSSTTFSITFTPTTVGVKNAQFTIESNDADEAVYTVLLTGTATASNASSILLTSPYTHAQNIPYQNYQTSNITNTGNDIEIASFTIRDGSPTDTDNLSTILTDISFTVTEWANLRSIAIYDGATEVGADELAAATVTFNGLNLEAPDGGTKVFTVRASFEDVVVDNAQIRLQISAATADLGGSVFSSANAGGVITSNAGNNNRIEVTATRLDFVQQPSDIDTFLAMTPSVTVSVNDALGNRDLDYTAAVILTTTGTYNTGAAPINDANNAAVAGLATFPTIVHSVAGTGLTLTATSGALATDVSSTFEIGPASAANNFFRSTASGDWDDINSWESSGDNANWLPATLSPTSVSRGITIRSGHTITCDTTESGDQMIVSSGGTFVIAAGGAFTLANGTGTDLTVAGTFTRSGGTFTQAASSTTSISASGIYNHSIAAATLTLPTATWSNGSVCNITGLNNAVDIYAPTLAQYFSTLNWNNDNQVGRVIINSATFRTRTLNIGNISANANNALCLADTGTQTNLYTVVNVANGKLIASMGTAVTTMTISSTVTVSGGEFLGTLGSGSATVNVAGVTTISGGELIGSKGSGSATINIAQNAAVSGTGKLVLIDNASSGNVNFSITPTNRNLTLSGTGQILFERVSSAAGVAIINVGQNFSSTATTVPALDFGTGTVSGNGMYIKGTFSKSGTGTFTTTSANPALGFVFNNTAARTFTYSGTNSLSVNYTIPSGGQLSLSSGLTLAAAAGPVSVFTVQTGGRLNLAGQVIAGNATTAQFTAQTGSIVTTTSTSGLGGTGASGNFQGFGSVNPTPAPGRVALAAGVSYIFGGNTTAPFPVAGGGTFGNPADITINATVVSNMTSALTVTGTFSVPASRSFSLFPTTGNNLVLNNGQLSIAGTFSNNGENQILNGGGSPTITINGTFITRDAQGYVGANAAIPTITPVLGASSIIRYDLGGNQVVQGSPAYRNLTLSNSGTKTLDANTSITGTLLISSPVIFDTQTFNAGGTGTNLNIANGATYRTSGTGTKPDALGTYTLGNTSTVEFNGANALLIRQGISYGRIVINGSDVATNSATVPILLQSGGAFTVNNGGVFKFSNTNGFTGSTTTAISNAPSITPVLNVGSTVEYAGDNQFITPFATYRKVRISGSGIKTIPGTGEILIGDDLTITSSTLQIDANRLLTVTNGITNTGGILDVQDDGNLVQITDGTTNTGDMVMTRTTRAMAANDFVYWGQPIQGSALSQIPTAFNLTYVYNINGTINGTWSAAAGTNPGQGFITRVASGGSIPFVFEGVPNNGPVTVSGINSYDNGATVSSSGNVVLLGNPFPSAISASLLIAQNPTVLEGTLFFWTALTPINNNVYSADDYATWNGTGSVATSDDSGGNDLLPSGYIAAGQGFFARLRGDGNVTFNNSIRRRTVTDNSQFFKPQPGIVDENPPTGHRLWINLTKGTTHFRQTLIGYVGSATNDFDAGLDSESFTSNSIDIYSVLDNRRLVIQGRELPFLPSDVVPMGFRVNTPGVYKISIAQLEGVFNSDQDIYLEDLLLNTVHDLKAAPYTFTSVQGTHNNRFVLRYTDATLGQDDLAARTAQVYAFRSGNTLQVTSGLEPIASVTVYDLLGRELLSAAKLDGLRFETAQLAVQQQTLIVKITLANGIVVSRKVVY